MKLAVGALLALAVFAAAAPARAYVRSEVPGSDGICLFWDERELPWVAARGDAPGLPLAEALPVFEASFRTWAEVACTDLVFLAGGEIEERDVGFAERGRNENVVLFRNVACDDAVPDRDRCWSEGDCANRYDCWEFGESVIAVTTTTFSQVTGEIVDADIEFNGGSFDFTTTDGPSCRQQRSPDCVATDLENTATHEIGHLLGLDHSAVRESTMYASAPLGETGKRTLHVDDVAGICAIYPAGEPTSVCVRRRDLSNRTPGASCSCGSSGRPGLEALLALAPLRWLVARRRRRPPSGAGPT